VPAHGASASLAGAGPAAAQVPVLLWGCHPRVPTQTLQRIAAIPAEGHKTPPRGTGAPPLRSELAEAPPVPQRWRWSAAGFCGAAALTTRFAKVLDALERLRGQGLVPLEWAIFFGSPEGETIFLCSEYLEDAADFSSDKLQQSTSAVTKACQIFHTLVINAFEEYHAQASSTVMSIRLSSAAEP